MNRIVLKKSLLTGFIIFLKKVKFFYLSVLFILNKIILEERKNMNVMSTKIISGPSLDKKIWLTKDLNESLGVIMKKIMSNSPQPDVVEIAGKVAKSSQNAIDNYKYHKSFGEDIGKKLLFEGPIGVYKSLVKNLNFNNRENPLVKAFADFSNQANKEEKLLIHKLNITLEKLSEIPECRGTISKLNNLITGAAPK